MGLSINRINTQNNPQFKGRFSFPAENLRTDIIPEIFGIKQLSSAERTKSNNVVLRCPTESDPIVVRTLQKLGIWDFLFVNKSYNNKMKIFSDLLPKDKSTAMWMISDDGLLYYRFSKVNPQPDFKTEVQSLKSK